MRRPTLPLRFSPAGVDLVANEPNIHISLGSIGHICGRLAERFVDPSNKIYLCTAGSPQSGSSRLPNEMTGISELQEFGKRGFLMINLIIPE